MPTPIDELSVKVSADTSGFKAALDDLATGSASLEEIVDAGALTITGDVQAFGLLFGLLDPPDPAFAIVPP